MRITEVSYLRRRNLGNYEHEEIQMGAVLEQDDSARDCLGSIRNLVEAEMSIAGAAATYSMTFPSSGGNQDSSQSTKGEKSEPEIGGTSESQVKAPIKEKATRKPKAAKETLVADTAPSQGVVINHVPENSEPEQTTEAVPAEVAPVAPPKEDKPKRTLRKAGTPYARENELHKKLVGELLDREFPGWKRSELFAKAKAASVSMAGSEFLDAEGLILEAFKAEFRKKMA